MYIHYLVIVFSGKGCGPFMNKLEFPSTKDAFSFGLVDIGLVVLEKKFNEFRQWILKFPYFSLLGKRHCPSFEKCLILFNKGCFVITSIENAPMALEKKNLDLPSIKMPFAKFGWNWPSGSGEEYF